MERLRDTGRSNGVWATGSRRVQGRGSRFCGGNGCKGVLDDVYRPGVGIKSDTAE